jgi:anti-sigma B factor antagonist
MKIKLETKGSVLVANVEETQIGADSAEEFKNKILAGLPTEKRRVAVNLSKVEFVDSSGLGALVSLLKAVRPGGNLVLFGLKSSVREILRLTHLDTVFNCQSDETHALNVLKS